MGDNMSYIKSLPKTKFKIAGSTLELESVNILKSFVFSSNLKNSNSTKSVFYDQVKRLEYLAYTNYSSNTSLYWITPILNGIDSFRKIPKSQSIEQRNITETYTGKVYYVLGAKQISSTEIDAGDLILISAGSDWKYGGIVKEYDPIFRRIILVSEEENVDNSSDPSANPTIEIYKKTNDGFDTTPNTNYNLGRKEDEVSKVVKILGTGIEGSEVSPYMTTGGESFDFTDEPSGTIGVSLAADNLNLDDYRFETLLDQKLNESAEYKNIYFTSTGLAFKLSSFLTKLIAQNIERGQIIRVT